MKNNGLILTAFSTLYFILAPLTNTAAIFLRVSSKKKKLHLTKLY